MALIALLDKITSLIAFWKDRTVKQNGLMANSGNVWILIITTANVKYRMHRKKPKDHVQPIQDALTYEQFGVEHINSFVLPRMWRSQVMHMENVFDRDVNDHCQKDRVL